MERIAPLGVVFAHHVESWEQVSPYRGHIHRTLLVPRAYDYMGAILVGLNCHILLLTSALSSTSAIPRVKISF